MKTTVNEFLRENDLDKIMGMSYRQYTQMIEIAMGESANLLNNNFLCYGQHGKIKFNVIRVCFKTEKLCSRCSNNCGKRG